MQKPVLKSSTISKSYSAKKVCFSQRPKSLPSADASFHFFALRAK